MTRPPGAASWGFFSDDAPTTTTGPEGQSVSGGDDADAATAAAATADDPTGAVAHFLAIPWCRAHLRPAENGLPGAAGSSTQIRIVVPATRRRGLSSATAATTTTADGFRMSSIKTADNAFTNTLNTPDTISAYVVFYEEPAAAAAAAPGGVADEPLSLSPIVELKALMTVGPGMNGHIGVMHGGLVGTILDEVLGLLMPLNQRRLRRLRKSQQQQQQQQQQNETQSQALASHPDHAAERYSPAEAAAAASATVRHGFVTGFLNTTYVRPVRTLTTILVTARFTRMEGPRKFYVEGAIWDEDAQLRAKAEAVFIALREKL